MSDLDQRFSDEERHAFIKQIADKLFQGIKKIADAKTEIKRRWIWELIQNAKDVKNNFGGVSIKIELGETYMHFSHNGSPFTLKTLTGLVNQVSSKYGEDKEVDVTGTFGTGFITTHMLSKVIEVRGILDLEEGYVKNINFTLDREADTVEELMEKVKALLNERDSFKDHDKFPKNYNYTESEDNYPTVFSYPIDANTIKYVYQGVEDLIKCSPYAFLFNPKIKNITIVDTIRNETQVISRGDNKYFAGHLVPSITINKEERFIITSSTNESVSVSFPIDWISENEIIVKPLELTPVLFKEFPLVGSETFGYGMVINSRNFYPTEQRDAVRLYLDDGKIDKEVEANREELLKAIDIAAQMIGNLASGEKVCNKLYLLTKSEIDFSEQRQEVLDWYKYNLQIPFRKVLFDLPLVRTYQGNKAIANCKFPVYDGPPEEAAKFYDLVADFLPDSVPVKEDFTAWYKIVKADPDSWPININYGLIDLVSAIHSLKSVSLLREINIGSDWNQWMNDLFAFIYNNNLTSVYNDYNIIPSQSQNFIQLSEASIDSGIPEIIKDISVPFQRKYRDNLVPMDIECPELKRTLTLKEVSAQINTDIGSSKHDKLSPEQVTALCKLNLWYDNSNEKSRWKIVKHFGAFLSDLNTEFQIDAKLSDFNFDPALKLLTKYIFSEIQNAQSIAQLNERYLKKTYEGTIVWLDELIRLVNDYSELKELLNTFAIFPNQNGGFRLRKDIKADKDLLEDKFLKPIFEKMFPKDKITDRLLSDGIDQTLVDESVDIKWVGNEIDNELKNREREINDPNMRTVFLEMINWLESNFSKYGQYFKWLSQRKADLFLQTLEKEEDRNSIFKIMVSKKDLRKLAELAVKIDDIDSLAQIVSIAKENGVDLIKLKNITQLAGALGVDGIDIIQNLAQSKLDEIKFRAKLKEYGDSAEKAFKEALEEIETSYNIDNPDYGLDFRIRHPQSNKEYYVEIKSTVIGSESVKMSSTQGRTAQREKERYSLCAVSRPPLQIVTKEQFIDSARFVTDIGGRIEPKLNVVEDELEIIRDTGEGEIEIALASNDFSIHIKQSIYKDKLKFTEFVQFLKQYFGIVTPTAIQESKPAESI